MGETRTHIHGHCRHGLFKVLVVRRRCWAGRSCWQANLDGRGSIHRRGSAAPSEGCSLAVGAPSPRLRPCRPSRAHSRPNRNIYADGHRKGAMKGHKVSGARRLENS